MNFRPPVDAACDAPRPLYDRLARRRTVLKRRCPPQRRHGPADEFLFGGPFIRATRRRIAASQQPQPPPPACSGRSQHAAGPSVRRHSIVSSMNNCLPVRLTAPRQRPCPLGLSAHHHRYPAWQAQSGPSSDQRHPMPASHPSGASYR